MNSENLKVCRKVNRNFLGVMTVLTTSTIIQGLKNSLPQVSYLTALDIYLWACFLFVFAAVLEYVALNIMVRQRANASFKVSKSSYFIIPF